MFDYIEENGMDTLIYDPSHKTEFAVQESLRMYIERNGRPFNYLPSVPELLQEHQRYYQNIDENVQN